MGWAAPVGVLVAAAVCIVLLLARPGVRRWRWRRRLHQAENEVAAAMADGRLHQPTGEALLQHLEGLRHQCSRKTED